MPTFGDQPGDVVTNSQGDVLSGVSLSLYPTKADAVAGTNLLATVVTNVLGRWSYTDPSLTVVWVRDPGGQVWAVEDPASLSSTYVPQVQSPTPEATVAEMFRVQPFTAGSGPFRLLTNSIINSDATYNHAAYIGWNPGTTHDNYITTKPALALGFEDNYTDAGGTPLHGMEFYLEYCSADRTVQTFRPFYARVDTGTANAKNVTIHFDIGTDAGPWVIRRFRRSRQPRDLQRCTGPRAVIQAVPSQRHDHGHRCVRFRVLDRYRGPVVSH